MMINDNNNKNQKNLRQIQNVITNGRSVTSFDLFDLDKLNLIKNLMYQVLEDYNFPRNRIELY